jgi:hypothetical protein
VSKKAFSRQPSAFSQSQIKGLTTISKNISKIPLQPTPAPAYLYG